MVTKPKAKNNQQVSAVGTDRTDIKPAESSTKNKDRKTKKHK